MEKTIVVSEFVKKYDSTTDKMKLSVLKEIKSEKYIDYEIKIARMTNILQHTSFDTNGEIKFQSPAKHMLFAMAIIDMYTNLKINDNNIINDFNMLNKSGLIDVLLSVKDNSVIPTREIIECTSILNMLEDDFIANYCDLYSVIERVSTKILKQYMDIFNDVIEQLTNNKNAEDNY